MVGLIREPENPYDANAIRVENIAAEKVGHLNRQLAAQVGKQSAILVVYRTTVVTTFGIRDDCGATPKLKH